MNIPKAISGHMFDMISRHISYFLAPFLFSFVILLSVLDVFFFITGVPVDEITPSQKVK